MIEPKHIYTNNDRVAIDEEFYRTIDQVGTEEDYELVCLYNDGKEVIAIAKRKGSLSGFKIKKKHTNLGYGDGTMSELIIEKISLNIV